MSIDIDETPPAKVDLDAILKSWNEAAKVNNLPVALRLTDQRRKHLRARLAEPEWDLAKILEEIRTSDFLKGANPRGWKVSFDFILTQSGYLKILEGKYRNGRTRQGLQATNGKYEGLSI